MSCYFSHLSGLVDSCEIIGSLNSGSLSSETAGTAVSSSSSAEMSKGCLFPDAIPNRDVSQSFLIRLTREGSNLGGFHFLPKKGRITWGIDHNVYIYFINTKTTIKEYNKGLRRVYI